MKKFGFGFMRLPVKDKEIDMVQVKEMVDMYIAAGFNYFDTAYRYMQGRSEPALREALVDRYPRESYVIATKLSNEFMKKAEEQQEVFERQMERLGCGYIDWYLLHNQGAYTLEKSRRFKSFDFIKEKRDMGLIRHIGMSWHDSAELLDKTLTEHPEIEMVQIQLNYLDWDNESVQSRKCLEAATAHGKIVVVMEPVKGGTLADIPEKAKKLLERENPEASAASWAIRFAASQEGVSTVLSGMSSLRQMRDNLSFMTDFRPLTDKEFKAVMEAAEIIRDTAMIQCTGCRYCTETCPKNIPIPDYLSLLQKGHFSSQFVYYFNLAQSHGRAGDCIECRQCEKHCPQHIEITKYLKELSHDYDGFKGWENGSYVKPE